MLQTSINPINKDVFKGDLLVFLKIPDSKGFKKFTDREFAIHRHDFVARLIIRAMERNREPDLLRQFSKFFDLRHQTRS